MPAAPRGDKHQGCTPKLTALQRRERIHPIIDDNPKRLLIHEPMQLNSILKACQHSHTILLQLENTREDNTVLASVLPVSWSSSLQRIAVVVSTHHCWASAQDSQLREKVHRAYNSLVWSARSGQVNHERIDWIERILKLLIPDFLACHSELQDYAAISLAKVKIKYSTSGSYESDKSDPKALC